MTDNDIIKALEEWIKALKDDYKRLQVLGAPMDCFEESHTDNIRVLSNALDLINRQKAEIESLQKMQQLTRAEAVKEFADLSIKRICENVTPIPQQKYLVNMCIQEIENTKQEMVGDTI